MSDLIQIVVAAIVQGLLEFIPVSSSGHLAIVDLIFGWETVHPNLDAAVHFGSLFALLYHLRGALRSLLSSRGRSVTFDEAETISGRQLFKIAIWGTAPLVVVGLVLTATNLSLDVFATPIGIGATLLASGAVMLSTRFAKRAAKNLAAISHPLALTIGLVQMVAVLPGISRSGATVTGGVWGGLNYISAVRMSLLLAVPALLGAGVLVAADGLAEGGTTNWGYLGLAVAISAVVSLGSIQLLIRVVRRFRLLPFAVYSLAAGTVLLVLGISGVIG